MPSMSSSLRNIATLIAVLVLFPLVATADAIFTLDRTNYTAIANDLTTQVIDITGSVMNSGAAPIYTELVNASSPILCTGCTAIFTYNSQGPVLIAPGGDPGDVSLVTLIIPMHTEPALDNFFFLYNLFIQWGPTPDMLDMSTNGTDVAVTAIPEPASLLLFGIGMIAAFKLRRNWHTTDSW